MNLDDLQTWHYVIIGGVIVLVLSFVLYFLPTKKLRVPGVLTGTLAGMAIGVAIGVIWLAGYGYKINAPGEAPPGDGKEKGLPPPPPGPGGGPGGGSPKGGTPKGGGEGPSPRVLLVNLVNVLDTLVDKPVTLTLSADDRVAIATQLKGLDKTGSISTEDAKAKLDAILKVVEKDRKALESIGYRWPSPDGKGPPKGGFGGQPKDSPNPFRDGSNGDHLKSLQERLEKR
jgi:hypothetical protein